MIQFCVLVKPLAKLIYRYLPGRKQQLLALSLQADELVIQAFGFVPGLLRNE